MQTKTPVMNVELLSRFAGKNVIITGGLGFIGSNLVRRLVPVANITIIDSLINTYGGNRYNIHGLESRVHVNISDIRDTHSLPTLLHGADFIFNLAGQTSHMDSMSDPVSDLEINCRAQLTFLEAVRKTCPAARLVFASTRQIYGRPDYLPVDESHPVRPVDVNGINKVAGEWYHTLYSSVYGIPSTVLRLTNTIGPRMRIKDARQTFVGIWIRKALEGAAIEVWGGAQKRDIAYVEDVVDAMLLCITNPAATGKVYNISGLGNVSLLEIAQQVIACAGAGTIKVMEYPADRKKIDIGDYYGSSEKIATEIGWRPQTTVAASIEHTVKFYKENMEKYL